MNGHYGELEEGIECFNDIINTCGENLSKKEVDNIRISAEDGLKHLEELKYQLEQE